MKFVHTADWQLGKVFGQVQDKAELLRQARLDAVKNILALAQREKADFVVAAGDLFEDNRIASTYIEQMAAIVSHSSVPVYLLPGNHDPLTQDSPYVRRADLFKGNAVVLRTEAAVAVPGGTLYPCPALTRTSRQDPTAWIPARQPQDTLRIGLAHGSVGTPTPNDFPIPARAARLRDLDYLALGHFHGTLEAGDNTWYSGTPEPTSFGENPGHALVVELAMPGAPPKIRPVAVATYQWQAIDAELLDPADVERLVAHISAVREPHKTLIRLRTRGRLTPSLVADVERHTGQVRPRFFHFRFDNDVVPELGEAVFRHPVLRHMAEVLTAKAGAAAEPGTAAATEASSARRGLAMLSLLARDAGFKGEGA